MRITNMVAAIPRKFIISQRSEWAGLLLIRDTKKPDIHMSMHNMRRKTTRNLGTPDHENLRQMSIITMILIMSSPACVSNPEKNIGLGAAPPPTHIMLFLTHKPSYSLF